MGLTDWENVTHYIDTVGTTLKTFSFSKPQDYVKVTIKGAANVTYSIGTQSGTLTPGQSIEVSEVISSFTLTAVSGTQQIEVYAKEDNTEKEEDNSNDVMSQLAHIATNVKVFGAKGDGVTDDTQAFINALVASKKKVFVPDGTYMVKVHDDSFVGNFMPYGVLELPDNMTFEMSKNAVLKVIPNSKGSYNVLMVKGKSNVTITGGKILGDRSQHTGSTGEWGYGISLLGAKNVTIRDVQIVDCWGDGINLQYDNTLGDCENIHIDNVISDNNRRQGMSIESAKNVRVLNSKFLNTNGINPQAGIDVEPAFTSANCENIVIEKCEFKGNTGYHILLHSNNNKKGIKIINCDFGDHTNESINVNKSIKGLQIQGNTFYKKGIQMYPHTDTNYGDAVISDNVFNSLNLPIGLNRNTLFANNKVLGDGTNALMSFTEPNTIIDGNIFDNGLQGIYCYNVDISDCTIKNNQIKNVTEGIQVVGISPSERVFILNNVILDNKNSGITIRGLTKGTIKGNNIVSDTLLTANIYYGIQITSLNNTLFIEGNTVKVPSGVNKFLKAIFGTNFSENQNIKLFFNSVKDSCVTTANEIDMTGLTGTETNYNITNA